MLIERIKADALEARKNRAPNASFIVTLLSEAQNIGKNKGNRQTTDEEVIALVKKFKLNAQEVIDALISQGRSNDPAVASASQEMNYLNTLLPEQLSTDALTAIIQAMILQVGYDKKNMGKVMSMLKSEFFGRYDGNEASKIVKQLIGM
ncbi:MAG: GatB/YqeY domain-containing protein [Candidatus Nitrosotenuis sp.]